MPRFIWSRLCAAHPAWQRVVRVHTEVETKSAEFIQVKMLDEVFKQSGKSLCVCHFALG